MVTRRMGPTTSFEERVGLVLVEGGFITRQQLTQAQEISHANGTGLLDTLVSSGMLAQETLVTVLSFQLRIPVVDIRHANINPQAVRLVSESFARRNTVLPLGFDDLDHSLRVATRMPTDFRLSAVLSGMADRQVKFVLAMGGDLAALIDLVYKPGMVTILQKTSRFYIPGFMEYLVDPGAAGRIPKEDALRHRVLPLSMGGGSSLVVVTTRLDPTLQAELASKAGCPVEFQLAWGGEVDDELVNRVYTAVAEGEALAPG